MKYFTTTWERFGIIEEVENLQGKYEVITDKEILDFVQKHQPHLVTFDGQRAYTNCLEELEKYIRSINNNLQDYRSVFIKC
jgi:hypothetical protein